jgi:MerR family transcriptional regulator, light-induced transcriptional regulator
VHSNSTGGGAEPAALSISELAARTGVPQATLRSWEARYGVPRPQRLAGGHRRYTEGDVALVERILRRRDSGLSLQAAVAQAGAQPDEAEPSVFAALRRRHPDLVPQVLSTSTLLALSRAIEDECCARAERPVLFAGFQREDFYRRSRSRWSELARTAQVAVVFADFSEPSAPGQVPIRVPLASTAPLRREWMIVCDAPDYPVCLAAWERPGHDAAVGVARRFEAVWAVDPAVVRDAARTCAGLTEAFSPQLARTLSERLAGTPPAASADLRRATGLLNRMVGYLDGARRP